MCLQVDLQSGQTASSHHLKLLLHLHLPKKKSLLSRLNRAPAFLAVCLRIVWHPDCWADLDVLERASAVALEHLEVVPLDRRDLAASRLHGSAQLVHHQPLAGRRDDSQAQACTPWRPGPVVPPCDSSGRHSQLHPEAPSGPEICFLAAAQVQSSSQGPGREGLRSRPCKLPLPE